MSLTPDSIHAAPIRLADAMPPREDARTVADGAMSSHAGLDPAWGRAVSDRLSAGLPLLVPPMASRID